MPSSKKFNWSPPPKKPPGSSQFTLFALNFFNKNFIILSWIYASTLQSKWRVESLQTYLWPDFEIHQSPRSATFFIKIPYSQLHNRTAPFYQTYLTKMVQKVGMFLSVPLYENAVLEENVVQSFFLPPQSLLFFNV